MKKISIPVNDDIITLFPEAILISQLPRKKKKALKIKIGKQVAEWLVEVITKEVLTNESTKQSIKHG